MMRETQLLRPEPRTWPAAKNLGENPQSRYIGAALQRQTPIGWPNRPRKVGEPDGLLLLRVDQTIVRLVFNPLDTAHGVPHRRGQPRGRCRPRVSQLQCV